MSKKHSFRGKMTFHSQREYLRQNGNSVLILVNDCQNTCGGLAKKISRGLRSGIKSGIRQISKIKIGKRGDVTAPFPKGTNVPISIALYTALLGVVNNKIYTWR